jgi:hypothetical protein
MILIRLMMSDGMVALTYLHLALFNLSTVESTRSILRNGFSFVLSVFSRSA